MEKKLQNIADVLRRDSILSTSTSGSGHPTSCMSCAEIMSVLFFNQMAYDVKNPFNPDNDEFIMSKGHAAPILYSALQRSGCINEDLNSLRNIDSPLEGHPVPRSLDWIKVATGSLGQGLSAGAGMAMAMKIQKRKSKVYVLLGDSELAEGSVYEAINFAAYYKLNNLIAIIDINRLGQSGETMYGHDIPHYKNKFEGFGWNVLETDGHNVKQLIEALNTAKESERPTMILARTYKGKGVSFLENKEGWHGKPIPEDKLEEALSEIGDVSMPTVPIKKPESVSGEFHKAELVITEYEEGKKIATREAYGDALLNLARSDASVLVIDAEVSNSTYSDSVKKNVSTRAQFVENFIAEQNMIGVALGLSKKGFNVFASSFAAFLSRAHDQIRMSAVSSGDFVVCGSHAGVSIGEDGASQMALEDISMFRALNDSIVLYPSDAVSTEKLIYLVSGSRGIKYIRTTRANTPIIYSTSEEFSLGDFKVLKQSSEDTAVLV